MQHRLEVKSSVLQFRTKAAPFTHSVYTPQMNQHSNNQIQMSSKL